MGNRQNRQSLIHWPRIELAADRLQNPFDGVNMVGIGLGV
jgi:hypothetical protein